MKKTATSLLSVFSGVNKQLEAFVANISSVFQHKLEQGLANERILKNILNQYLPKKYSVISGKIMDYQGSLSSQLDIIIYDSFEFAPIYIEEDFGIISLEAVYAVIEVKTTLTSSTLKKAIHTIESVKKLRSYFSPSKPSVDNSSPIGICFSYKTKKNFFKSLKSGQAFKHFHIVCSLDSGCTAVPISNKKNTVNKKDALLFFFANLTHLLCERQLQAVSLLDYYNPAPQPKNLW